MYFRPSITVTVYDHSKLNINACTLTFTCIAVNLDIYLFAAWRRLIILKRFWWGIVGLLSLACKMKIMIVKGNHDNHTNNDDNINSWHDNIIDLCTASFIYSLSMCITLKCGFPGARERFAKEANVKKNGNDQQSYFMLQKIGKPSLGFGSVVNCSRASFLVRRKKKKFLANVSRIPGRVLLVICSQTCLQSFVICAWPTQDVRDVRKQRSSPDYFSTYSRTVRVLLLIRFTFATINLRMSQSIPELFPSYKRTKTDTFTNVWRRFCALTWPLVDIMRVADALFAF